MASGARKWIVRSTVGAANGWEASWKKRYCAGVALLDLEDPSRVIGMSKAPLIAPEAPYETGGGFRNDVIFPTGAVLEPSGKISIIPRQGG